MILRVGPKLRSQPLACAITLAQAIPKGKHMDFIVQKATELGAAQDSTAIFRPDHCAAGREGRREEAR